MDRQEINEKTGGAFDEMAQEQVSDAEFSDELDRMRDRFDGILKLDDYQSMAPHLVVLSQKKPDGKRDTFFFAFIDFPETAEGRADMMEGIGKKYAQEFPGLLPQMIFFASEAWMATEKGKRWSGVLPADRPDRLEVLLVAGQTVDQRRAMATVPVTRDKDNRMVMGETNKVIGGDIGSDTMDAFYHGYFEGKGDRL